MKKIYFLCLTLLYTFNYSQQLEAELFEINYNQGLAARSLIKYQDKIIFSGSETSGFFPGNNYELWEYDFVQKKSALIKELVPYNSSPFNSDPQFTLFKGKVYFIAEMSDNKELWETDGTTAGTKKVFQFPERFQMDLTVNDDKILITSNKKVFVSDGTPAGSKLLKEFGGQVFDAKAFAGDNYFVFAAKNGTSGNMLYYTDGANEPVPIINTTDNAPLGIQNDLEFYTVNGKILFYGQSTTSNQKGLFSFDPISKKGNFIYQTIGVTSGQVLNDKLIFKGSEQPYGGSLFSTDGTVSNTIRLSNINNFVNSFSNQNSLQKIGNHIYFFTNSSERNRLWKTDGTPTGTVATEVIIPDYAQPNIIKFYPKNEFMMIENASHDQFYLMDAFENITSLENNSLREGYEETGEIIYASFTPKYGQELYRYNLTTKETSLFHDSIHKDGSFPVYGKSNNQNALIFTATDGEFSKQFYSVKNNEPPLPVKIFNSQIYAIPDGELFEVGNYFYVKPKSYTGIIAKTNGAAENTKLLNLPANNTITNTSIFENLRDESLVFTTYFSANGPFIRLWKNDNNSDEIKLVKEIPTGSNVESATSIFYNNEIYFTVQTADYKTQIWKTDGTSAGTMIAFNIPENSGDSQNIRLLQTFDNQLLFTSGDQLYKYNSNSGLILNIPFPTEDPFQNLGWNIAEKPNVIEGKLYLLSQYGYGSVFQFTDLQTAPTKIFSDNFFQNFSEFKKCGEQLYVGTGTFANKNSALWSVNLNNFASKKLVSNSSANPVSDLICVNNYVYFRKEDEPTIYRTNGNTVTPQNIEVLGEEQLTGDDKILKLYRNNDKIYFAAKTKNSGEELYYVKTELPVFLSTVDSQMNSQQIRLILYPNPASEFIKIKNETNLDVATYRIFDFSGKLILSDKYLNMTQSINISTLKSGNYIIEIKTKSGVVYSQQFIKK